MSQQTHLKAIETHYAGCRFRSRLEARWAVFFDTLSIKWEYEPQGMLVDGAPYLPDFYLPRLGLYVEVKGSESQVTPEYEDMLWRFALTFDGYADGAYGLLLLSSIPDASDELRLPIHACLRRSSIRLPDSSERQWGVDDLGAFFYPTKEEGAHIYFLGYNPGGALWEQKSTPFVKPFRPIRDAYAAARSARFEHGETGR